MFELILIVISGFSKVITHHSGMIAFRDCDSYIPELHIMVDDGIPPAIPTKRPN